MAAHVEIRASAPDSDPLGDVDGLKVKAGELAINAAFTTLTRPANATPYTAGDSISDNATAGSVTALVATVSDINDAPLILSHIAVATTDTGIGAKMLRAYVFNSDPTADSGVVTGDNSAYGNKRAGLIGTFTGLMTTMNDGAFGNLTPESGAPHLVVSPESGGKRLWIQYQTINDFTPSANSTTFAGRVLGFQARA